MTPVVESMTPCWVDNWIRLGLVSVDYDKELVGEALYDWVERRPEVLALAAENDDKQRVEWRRGVGR
jgi:hypothetical protein